MLKPPKNTTKECPHCCTICSINSIECENVICRQPFPQNDVVNKPSHYTQGGIECIDALKAALTPEQFIGFLKGNVIKYNWRSDHKNGVQDLEKAKWYLDLLIKTKRVTV